jgi:hypothetical protein
MAINGSSFMGATSNRASAGSTRVLSAKDSTNLVRTVNAININLININKMLQQQYTMSTKTKLQQQRKRNIEAENLRRKTTESALEAANKIGGFVSKGLIQPAKKITSTIFSLAQGFLKFFALTFVGWFSKFIVKWFKQDKNTKERQLRTWITKITRAVAIAGAVLLAIKVGIPIIMGLLGTITSVVITSLTALLNPLTWKVLLATGLTVLGLEGITGFVDSVVPRRKARKRVESILRSADEQQIGRYFNAANVVEIKTVDDGGRMRDDEFGKLLSLDDRERDVDIYKEINGVLKRQGKFKIDYLVSSGQAFGNNPDLRSFLTSITDSKQFPDLVGQAYSAKRELEQKELKIKSRGSTPDSERERAALSRKYENALLKAQQMYDTLRPDRQAALAGVGLSRQKLAEGEVFEMSNMEFQMKKISAIVQNLPFVRDIKTMQGQLSSGLGALSQQLDDLINVTVNAVASVDVPEDDTPEGEIVSPSNISPFDTGNPFIPRAKKEYKLVVF